jgi:hypothetical protein
MKILLIVLGVLVAISFAALATALGLLAVIRYFSNKMKKELEDEGFYD